MPFKHRARIAYNSEPAQTDAGPAGWLSLKWRKLKVAIVAIAGVGAVLGGLAGYWNAYQATRSGAQTLAAKPAGPVDAGPLSIAVLPFANLTGSAEQEYLADGLTVSIISDLARIRDAYVVSAATTQAFKGRSLPAKALGKELGVRYVLQGNVQRTGTKLRINAQLADAQSDAQLWSETFSGDTNDLFALQDQVTSVISNSVGRELVVRSARASERKSTATVAELVLKERALEYQQQSYATWRAIESMCREILAKDSAQTAVRADLAQSLMLQTTNFSAEMDESSAQKKKVEALTLASKVIADDPENGMAHRVVGLHALDRNDMDVALRALTRSFELRPKDPISYNNLAIAHYWLGQAEEAIDLVQRGIALDPAHPSATLFLIRSWAELMLGKYDAAIESSRKGESINAELTTSSYFNARIVAAYQLKGEIATAKTLVQKMMARDPKATISAFSKVEDLDTAPPAYRSYALNVLYPAMRAAGIPD